MEELETLFQQYIATSKYSRWLDEEGRREIWPEPVRRYVEHVIRPVLTGAGLKKKEIEEVCQKAFDYIRKTLVLPSMRALMTAGPALDRDHMAGYNCSFLAIDHPRAFDEALYILSCGTGLGFSVERQFINHLPEVAEEFHDTETVIKVKDSKIGWATALKETIGLLYSGQVPKFDVSAIRGAGERLKVFGGRASGPQPLLDLLNYCVRAFKGAAGRKLNSLEAHGIMCKIGEAIVVGGVRRSALISLSNLTDQRMRNAKSGQWWESHPEYSLANNSVAYTEKPDTDAFMQEWLALYQSKSGERGVFNRDGVKRKIKKLGRRNHDHEWGTNPCDEIALRSMQTCNLTEVVIRPEDTLEVLKDKVEFATILGTIQSTFTTFRYLRPSWKRNIEEERLLGVSFTGIFDHEVMSGQISYGDNDPEDWLDELREHAVATNKTWADKLGINQSTAVTCCKPAGTTSLLSNTSSGIHPRHSEWYLRAVRQDNKDSLTAFLKDQGVPNEPCVTRPESTTIFYFPMQSPDHAVTKDGFKALAHLNLWQAYNTHWAEHMVSVTVSVREHEWMEVGAWVFNNFDDITGISFLPADQGIYKQAPFQAITFEEYEAAAAKMPKSIDWSLLTKYEIEDETTGSRELACAGNACEIA